MYLLYAIYAVEVCLCFNKGPLDSSDLDLHLIHCSMDPHESDHKTASRSILAGLAQLTVCPTQRHTQTHRPRYVRHL